jgi:hypothetical protein
MARVIAGMTVSLDGFFEDAAGSAGARACTFRVVR